MERLTKRDADGQAMMDCQKCEADWTGKHCKEVSEYQMGDFGSPRTSH